MDLEFAERFHGHRSPGLVLGMRMVQLIYKKMGDMPKGKKIFGIAETRMCLPDALQIEAQTTTGNKNLIVYNYGKLALSIVLRENGEGYRVSLKKEAIDASARIKKFLLREGKLSHEERDKLIEDFLNLDEKYFKIEKIRIRLPQRDEQQEIVECTECGELQPKNFTVPVNGKFLCQLCSGQSYFKKI
ncbi:FmdE family protein [Thermodesulfovibrio sp. TK110]